MDSKLNRMGYEDNGMLLERKWSGDVMEQQV